MANIGFIGTGEIASAVVYGLADKGHSIVVSERNAYVAEELDGALKEVSIGTNQEVLDNSDIVWLCLMADVAREILPDLSFRPDQQVISAMVDVNLESLAELCAPATDIAITIPMPFIRKGGCPLPVYPESRALVETLGADNLVIPVASEQALNAHFGASALASAMFTQMRAGTDWLGRSTGDLRAAESYVVALFAGYLADMPKDGQNRFSEALEGLSTEGGLNATLRAHIEEAGVLDTLSDGLNGFRDRLGLPPEVLD